jgi:hypothetical protein
MIKQHTTHPIFVSHNVEDVAGPRVCVATHAHLELVDRGARHSLVDAEVVVVNQSVLLGLVAVTGSHGKDHVLLGQVQGVGDLPD